MLRVWTALQAGHARDEGATLVEYALLLVFIAVIAIAALQFLGNTVSDQVENVASTIGGTNP